MTDPLVTIILPEALSESLARYFEDLKRRNPDTHLTSPEALCVEWIEATFRFSLSLKDNGKRKR